MHGTSIHHVKCVKQVLSVVKFDIDNANKVMDKMLDNGTQAHNKDLYIVGEELGGVMVAWHYDACVLGIAHVILVD